MELFIDYCSPKGKVYSFLENQLKYKDKNSNINSREVEVGSRRGTGPMKPGIRDHGQVGWIGIGKGSKQKAREK